MTVAGTNDKSDCPTREKHCKDSVFGCCDDGKTFAHSYNKKGCKTCKTSKYGCCPDGKTFAKGVNLLGCLDEEGSGDEDCQNFENECSPNTITLNTNCKNTKYGCCPDGHTVALKKDHSDCRPIESQQFSCINSKYECCPDGINVPSGPNFEVFSILY